MAAGAFHEGWSVRGPHGAKGDPLFLQMFLDYANNLARAEFKYPGSMFRISKDGRLYLTPQFLHNFGYRMQRSFVDVIRKAGVRAAFQTGMMSVAFSAAMDAASKANKDDVTTANMQIASAMRNAVSNNYGNVIGRKVQVPSYRVGKNRYSGGALRNALKAPSLAVGDKDGVKFIDQDRLNLEARHWARMNWGVAPASTPPSWQGKLMFAGQAIGTVGFRVQPRPPMFLPAGFWKMIEGKISSGPLVSGQKYDKRYSRSFTEVLRHPVTGQPVAVTGRRLGQPQEVQAKRGGQPPYIKKRGWRFGRGGDENSYGSYRKSGIRVSRQGFYPMDKTPRYPTRGVVGVNIFDFGLKAMVREFEYTYERLVLDWVRDAYRSTKETSGRAGKAFMAVLNLDPKDPMHVEFIEKVFPEVSRAAPPGSSMRWKYPES